MGIQQELSKIKTPFNPESGKFDALAVQPRIGAWALNGTGYELKEGYIVAITGYDATNKLFTIARPTADDMPNIAVVKTSVVGNGSTYLVELVIPGENSVWYDQEAGVNKAFEINLWRGSASISSGDKLGSKANSFECKSGGATLIALGSGYTYSGSGRCRSRFFNGAAAGITTLRIPIDMDSQITLTERGDYYYAYDGTVEIDPVDFAELLNPTEPTYDEWPIVGYLDGFGTSTTTAATPWNTSPNYDTIAFTFLNEDDDVITTLLAGGLSDIDFSGNLGTSYTPTLFYSGDGAGLRGEITPQSEDTVAVKMIITVVLKDISGTHKTLTTVARISGTSGQGGFWLFNRSQI